MKLIRFFDADEPEIHPGILQYYEKRTVDSRTKKFILDDFLQRLLALIAKFGIFGRIHENRLAEILKRFAQTIDRNRPSDYI